MDSTHAVHLLRLCANEGHEDQWHELCLHLRPMLRRFIVLRLKQYGDQGASDSVLDDLVQEVFCRLLSREQRLLRLIAELSPGAAVSYLMQVCRTVVVDRYRHKCSQSRGGGASVAALHHSNCDAMEAEKDTDPERMFLVREARRVLRRALREVAGPNGKRDSEIFELATVYSWTSREIAEVAEPRLSTTAIDVSVTRTRKKLEQRLFPEIQCLRRDSRSMDSKRRRH